MFELVVERHFSAAHFLPDYDGPCQRLHGHNFIVRAYLRGEQLNAMGMLVDFREIKTVLLALLDELDHQNLNDLSAFLQSLPTTENIARYIAERLAAHDWGNAWVDRVEVWETPGQASIYYCKKIQ